MKAKKVFEAQDFQRHENPYDSLKIGDPVARKITSSLQSVNNIISSGFLKEDIEFNRTIEAIDQIKMINIKSIQTYFEKKFGWKFHFEGTVSRNGLKEDRVQPGDETAGDILTTEIGKGYTIKIGPSNSAKSFTVGLFRGSGPIVTTTASTTLKSLDKKIQNEIIKKYLK